ncbi:MAG: class I SAM-dependent methyltransferase, partial [Akkermansiaceae bacterium]
CVMSTPTSVPTNSSVKFANSQGITLSANILRLRRYSISFEIYNPYSVVQLSEVLRGFRIRLNGRLVYDGDAVVSSIVNTGVQIVCEATLSGGWKEVDFLSQVGKEESLVKQFDGFVDDWKRAHHVSTEFKINVADMQNLLIGVKRWLEQIDLGIRSTSTEDPDALEKDVISKIEQRMVDEFHPLMMGFENSARSIPTIEQASHKFYVRRQIHPLVLCSPFTYRTFSKPLGYAGDYEMVNMMLRSPYEGGTLYAKMLNRAFLETAPVLAHRNRISYLVNMLDEEAQRCFAKGRRLKVLNLGCGPAQEIQRFIKNKEISDQCDFTLLDFSSETLDFTAELLNGMITQMGRSTKVEFVERSVHQLLKQASKGDVDFEWESYDVVYCAGLFDYLSQKVCKRLVEMFARLLRSDGKLVVTNVASTNPSIGWMEYVLEWNLIYRSDWEMLDLIPLDGTVLQSDLKRDETGVNLFLELRKVQKEVLFPQSMT